MSGSSSTTRARRIAGKDIASPCGDSVTHPVTTSTPATKAESTDKALPSFVFFVALWLTLLPDVRPGDNQRFMSDPSSRKGLTAPPGLDLEDVRRATDLLEAVTSDRGLLASVPLELRQALLIAAGHVSRPESFQEKRLVKAMRRARRRRDEAEDRETRAATGIRAAREAAVFVAPAPAPAGRPSRPATAAGAQEAARPATSARRSSRGCTSSTTRCARSARSSTTPSASRRRPSTAGWR